MLRLAFAINILILLPVCTAMLLGRDGGMRAVFAGAGADVPVLGRMVLAMWLAILLASLAGLVWPRPLWPVLAIQIVYKSLWLLMFAWPAWRVGAVVPWGVVGSFIAIVLAWPLLLWAARPWAG